MIRMPYLLTFGEARVYLRALGLVLSWPFDAIVESLAPLSGRWRG